jgi:hypothetical protein
VIASLRSWSETTGDGRERLYGQSHHGRGCTHLKSLCFCELRHKYVKMRSSLGHLAMMSGEVQRKKLWDDGTMGRWESCPLIASSHHPIIPSSRHPVSSCRTNCSAPEGQRATAASTRSTSVSPSSIHGRRAGENTRGNARTQRPLCWQSPARHSTVIAGVEYSRTSSFASCTASGVVMFLRVAEAEASHCI